MVILISRWNNQWYFRQQLREDQNLYSFSVDLGARAVYKTPEAMKVRQDSVNESAEVACDTELAMEAKDIMDL